LRRQQAQRQRARHDVRARRQEAEHGEGRLHSEHHALEHHGSGRPCGHLGCCHHRAGGKLMLRTDKEASVADIRATFARMSSAVFVDYAGMTVEEISNLRSKFRARGVEYKVFKNTLVKKALAGESFVDALSKTALRGMTGVALSFEEPSAAARVVRDF